MEINGFSLPMKHWCYSLRIFSYKANLKDLKGMYSVFILFISREEHIKMPLLSSSENGMPILKWSKAVAHNFYEIGGLESGPWHHQGAAYYI